MMRSKSIAFAVLAALTIILFISCSEDRTTESYETHPTNWMDPYSPDWHGTAAIGSKGESCGGCHTLLPTEPRLIQFDNGPESGGEVVDHAVACYTCHSYPHKEDVAVSHVTRFKYSDSWNTITTCQSCHGVDFAGGRSGASCNECHTQQGGPAACNTCHGLPPTLEHPLQGRNPGAHYAHSRYACTECHNSVNGLEHIDTLPADVAFGDAHISNANGFPASYSNPSNCATYCHSNLHQGAPMVAVSWNTGQTLNACRSCHQIPPPSPFHPTENRCHFCHPNIDPASNYNDANQIRFLPGDTLHVNGTVNAIFPG
ncbi:MAG: hypothetical protein IPP40_04235 [bacterium]|nr:hypothetical protein [bacterium]